MAIRFIYDTDNNNWEEACEVFLKAYGREKQSLRN